jgi:DNA invertase Pin-like site-specific DNA recombinase
MLAALGGLAEFEGELISSRTGEGRIRAKARGLKLDRKPKLTPHQKRESLERAVRAAKKPEPRSAAYTTSGGWTILLLS